MKVVKQRSVGRANSGRCALRPVSSKDVHNVYACVYECRQLEAVWRSLPFLPRKQRLLCGTHERRKCWLAKAEAFAFFPQPSTNRHINFPQKTCKGKFSFP